MLRGLVPTLKPDLGNASGGSVMLLSCIGFIATVTSIISLPPQLYQTYKTKSAKDVSLFMLINFFVCSASWVAYGILTHATEVWVTNIVCGLFALIMIVLKVMYDAHPQ